MNTRGREQPIALLFDIDGTLIDSSGAGGGALLDALKHAFGLADATPVALHGRTDRGIMTELLDLHGISASTENLTRLCDEYFLRLPEVLRQREGRVLPGVTDLLERLRQESSCHLGVLTGNMPTSADAKLRHFGLRDFFAFGIYGDLAAERPALALPAFEIMERHFRFPPPRERIILVGDTPLDIELAKAMGARCLAVCTGGFEAAELEAAGASHVVEDLQDTEAVLSWCLGSMKEIH